MSILEVSLFSCLLAALQAVGLLSTWLARRSVGSSREMASQWLFLLAMFGVGLATLYSLLIGGAWLAPGTTLSLMAVVGTCEFRGPHTLPRSL